MEKKIRTILFFICLLLFFIIAPLAVLYSQGYRFNLETKKITQTGGLFLKVVPSDAEVYINGELEEKTSFLFGSILIENLLPKTYKIEVKKEGYHPWQKSLEIKERQVTEVKNIVLVPKLPEFILLEKDVENFWFSPTKKKVVYKKINETGLWNLELFDIPTNTRRVILSQEKLKETDSDTQQNEELMDVKWSLNEERILVAELRSSSPFAVARVLEKTQKNKYFVIELAKTPAVLTSLDFLGENIKEVSFNPKNSQEIFFIVSLKYPNNSSKKMGYLFRVDYSKKEIPRLVLTSKPELKTPLLPKEEHLITFIIFGGDIIWLADAGFLYKSNFDSGEILEVLNLKPHPVKEEVNYEIFMADISKIFLKEGDSLYYLDPELREFKKVSEKVSSLSFSPDLKKIIYFSDSEIWLFYLERLYDQPQREAQEKTLVGRWAEKINKCSWFTSHYLIFNTGNKIKVAETDDRDRINIIDLAEFNNPEIFLGENNKKLYILTNKNIVVASGLLP